VSTGVNSLLSVGTPVFMNLYYIFPSHNCLGFQHCEHGSYVNTLVFIKISVRSHPTPERGGFSRSM